MVLTKIRHNYKKYIDVAAYSLNIFLNQGYILGCGMGIGMLGYVQIIRHA